MCNNKGQTLVLFVIVLPILLFILVLVIDIGKAIILKHELNNINEIVLDYGLDNLGNEKLENDLLNLIKLNKDDIDSVNVSIDNNQINIKLVEKNEGMFSSLLDISMFRIESSYVGYIIDNKKRIERMGD